MRRILFIITTLFLTLLASCQIIPHEQEPNGTIPTKEFTVNSYVNDNAIFEEKRKITVTGNAEGNVVINLELINKNGKTIVYKEVTTDEKTNEWNISFETPKGSFDEYKIKIYDSYKKYTKEYKKIRFGHVYALVGDDIFNQELINNSLETNDEINYNDNIGYFYQGVDSSKWLLLSENEQFLGMFAYQFGNEMLKTNNLPVGIVLLYEETTNLEEWLFKETIDNHNLIKKFLTSNHRYIENPTKIGEMSFLGENRIKPLKGIAFSNIIWSQGRNEIANFSDNTYLTNYFQMFYTLLDSWREYFGAFSFTILQVHSLKSENVESLRLVQETISNYYSYATIVPTFDLNKSINGEFSEEIDFDSLTKRVKDVIVNNKIVSKYSNIILEINNEEELVTSIQIEFNNTSRLLIDVSNNKNLINYFDVYYDDEDTGRIKLDIPPQIKDNFIIVSLEYEEEIIDEMGNKEIITKVYNKSQITIEYGWYSDLSNVNLFNDSGIPLLPFTINIE